MDDYFAYLTIGRVFTSLPLPLSGPGVDPRWIEARLRNNVYNGMISLNCAYRVMVEEDLNDHKAH